MSSCQYEGTSQSQSRTDGYAGSSITKAEEKLRRKQTWGFRAYLTFEERRQKCTIMSINGEVEVDIPIGKKYDEATRELVDQTDVEARIESL